MGALISMAEFRADRTAKLIAAFIKPSTEWPQGMHRLHAAKSLRDVMYWRHCVAVDEYGENSPQADQAATKSKEAFHWHQRIELEQLLIAAPNVSALRWKEDRYKWGNRYTEVADAIKRDRKALAGRLAAIRKKARARADRQAMAS